MRAPDEQGAVAAGARVAAGGAIGVEGNVVGRGIFHAGKDREKMRIGTSGAAAGRPRNGAGSAACTARSAHQAAIPKKGIGPEHPPGLFGYFFGLRDTGAALLCVHPHGVTGSGLLRNDAHLVYQVLGTGILFDDKEHVADIYADGTLQLGLEGDIAAHGFPVTVEG